MKKVIAVVNGFYRPKGLMYQLERFGACFGKRGVSFSVVGNEEINVYLDGKDVVSTLSPADAVVYLDKDKHIAYMMEKAGHRLFNSARAIELCDDKIRTYIALAGSGIRMPRTYSSPLLYRQEHNDAEYAARVEGELQYPIVVKEAYGSLGMQVYLAKNGQELRSIREQVKYKPHLYQEYVGERFGTDVRMILIGGKVVTAILRKSETDFRSNVELGGKAYPVNPDPAFVAVAEKAAQVLALDYCGVDILFGKGGEPVLCEVNSNAFFTASESVTGIDIAGKYTDYLLKEMEQRGGKENPGRIKAEKHR